MRHFLSIFLGLSTAVFIICIATILTLNCTALYEADIDHYNLVESTGMSRKEIEANYKAMIDYNNLGGPDTLVFPTLTMSEGGRIHFEDVRRVFYAMEYAAIITGIISLAGILLMQKKKYISYRFWIGLLTLALPAAAGCYAALAWDSLFVTFHKLLFNNDYWLFDPATDPVINILPDGYFLHCLIMIIAIALAAAVFFLLWYIHGRKALKKRFSSH